MLKLGTQGISSLYLGGLKVKRAYVGVDLVAEFDAETPGKKTIQVKVSDTSVSSLLSAGILTVAGVRITEEAQTIETELVVVGISFELTKSIKTARAVSVNGIDIGHVGEAGDAVSTTISTTEGMTVNIAFSTYAPSSRLPEGYTEVEYISFDGYGSVNTNVAANFLTGRYVFDAEFNPFSGSSSQAVMSSADSATSGSNIKRFSLAIGGAKRIYVRYALGASFQRTVSTTSGRIVADWDFPNGTLTFGETVLKESNISGTTGKVVYFRIPTYGGKIYSGQVYISGALKCDLVPCIDPSGVVGCYDIIQEKFRAPTNTATAGPAV